MTQDEARAAIETAFISQFLAACPDVDLFIDGLTEPDLQTQARSFIFFRVDWLRVEQSGMAGAAPPRRHFGEVVIGLFVPDGWGIRPFYIMAAAIENLLTLKTINNIVMQGMISHNRVPAVGWQARELIIPFYFDNLS